MVARREDREARQRRARLAAEAAARDVAARLEIPVPAPNAPRAEYWIEIQGRRVQIAVEANVVDAMEVLTPPGVRITADGRAKETAKALLRQRLSDEQRESYDNSNYFMLTGSEGNTYRITTRGNASGNVYWVVDGEDRGCYCAYPQDWTRIPVEDQFLGQMLALVTDEKAYMAKAYIVGGGYPPGMGRQDRGGERFVAAVRFANDCDCLRCRTARERW